VDEVVRGTVEQTLNALLHAEADRACGAARYERSPDRQDTRAGSYERKLATKAGEVTLTVPRLRKLPLETAIIERFLAARDHATRFSLGLQCPSAGGARLLPLFLRQAAVGTRSGTFVG
jgi:transposase-like protein